MRDPKNLHNICLSIIQSLFYKYGASGDRYIMASLSRLVTLSYQFDSANYTLKQAERLYKSKDTDEILSQYQLQNCIISYCGCYDTLLQVIYFAFKFGGKLNDEADLINVIENCRWRADGNMSHISLRNSLEGLLPNDRISALIKKLDHVMNNPRQRVATLANRLKHGGGLITRKYATYISNIGYVNCTIIKGKKDKVVDIKFADKASSFMAKWLYPHIVDIPVVLDQMYQQNEAIYKIVLYVYHLLEYDKLQELNNPLKDEYSNPLIK